MVDAAGCRVFLSYAHDSPEHMAAVRRLHDLLRESRIEATLDIYFDGPGQDWPRWMTRQVKDADFVLVIASPQYRRRADDHDDVPADEGRGVWYEARLLGEMIYKDKGRKSLRTILPVVLPGGELDDLPTFFTPYSSTCYRVAELSTAGITDLLRVLHGEPLPSPVPVGQRLGLVTLRHLVALDVRVAAHRVRTGMAVDGEAWGEREAPLPFVLDETAGGVGRPAGVWAALERPALVAAGELAGAGDRLTGALLEPAWSQRLAELVDSSAAGITTDVVVTTDGAGLSLPYELLRLPGNRVLCTQAGVRLVRRIRDLAREDPRPTPGPLKILAAVGAPERTTNAALDVEAEMGRFWPRCPGWARRR